MGFLAVASASLPGAGVDANWSWPHTSPIQGKMPKRLRHTHTHTHTHTSQQATVVWNSGHIFSAQQCKRQKLHLTTPTSKACHSMSDTEQSRAAAMCCPSLHVSNNQRRCPQHQCKGSPQYLRPNEDAHSPPCTCVHVKHQGVHETQAVFSQLSRGMFKQEPMA
eukprot:4584366-Amphidinium_carterae.3